LESLAEWLAAVDNIAMRFKHKELNLAGAIHSSLIIVMIYGFLATHLILTYATFRSRGSWAAVATFALPVVSELFWFVRFWLVFGLLNWLSLALLVVFFCLCAMYWMIGRFDIVSPRFTHRNIGTSEIIMSFPESTADSPTDRSQ
jgi:hypothetical protein